MPLLESVQYNPPLYLFNRHLETIVPSLFRDVLMPPYQRERVDTPDGDFLDLDWLRRDSVDKIVILTHGLEGSSESNYIKGMASKFYNNGWNVLAWNCRSCSGVMNRKLGLYHHGFIDDLTFVVKHAISKGNSTVVLMGFSMGGSITTKYLGYEPDQVPDEVMGGVVFSVPCKLESSAKALSSRANWVYRRRFLKKLINKIKIKNQQFPGIFDVDKIDKIRHFYEFDSRFTIKMYGFDDLETFYQSGSAANYLKHVQKPLLMVNAKNDPMLPDDCYPFEVAKDHQFLYLKCPDRGGHVGFWDGKQSESWADSIAYEFVISTILDR